MHSASVLREALRPVRRRPPRASDGPPRGRRRLPRTLDGRAAPRRASAPAGGPRGRSLSPGRPPAGGPGPRPAGRGHLPASAGETFASSSPRSHRASDSSSVVPPASSRMYDLDQLVPRLLVPERARGGSRRRPVVVRHVIHPKRELLRQCGGCRPCDTAARPPCSQAVASTAARPPRPPASPVHPHRELTLRHPRPQRVAGRSGLLGERTTCPSGRWRTA